MLIGVLSNVMRVHGFNMKATNFGRRFDIRSATCRQTVSFSLRERSLMTSHIRVGRGVQDSPQKGRYRVGQGRSKMAKKRGTVINERSLTLLRKNC